MTRAYSPRPGYRRYLKADGEWTDPIPSDVADLAAQAAQDRRDSDLLRWRWPVLTEYVVYPGVCGTDPLRVINEREGSVEDIDPEDAVRSQDVANHTAAAREYLRVNPPSTRLNVQVLPKVPGTDWVTLFQYTPGSEAQRKDAERRVRRLSEVDVRARIVEG